jgi:NAD-dependent histone deacetylase SIR2
MTKALYGQCADAQPTAFHHMLAKLAEEKHLLCLYTQNINGIETLLSPLSTQIPLQEPWPRTVQVHGSILKMGCTNVGQSWSSTVVFKGAYSTQGSQCAITKGRRSEKGMRSRGAGFLCPRIALYGEECPDGEEFEMVVKSSA